MLPSGLGRRRSPGHGLATRARFLDDNRFDLSLINNLELSRTELLDRRPAVCNEYQMQLEITNGKDGMVLTSFVFPSLNLFAYWLSFDHYTIK